MFGRETTIAWRITVECAYQVTIGGHERCVKAILCRDGKVRSQYEEATYDSLASWEKDARAEHEKELKKRAEKRRLRELHVVVERWDRVLNRGQSLYSVDLTLKKLDLATEFVGDDSPTRTPVSRSPARSTEARRQFAQDSARFGHSVQLTRQGLQGAHWRASPRHRLRRTRSKIWFREGTSAPVRHVQCVPTRE